MRSPQLIYTQSVSQAAYCRLGTGSVFLHQTHSGILACSKRLNTGEQDVLSTTIICFSLPPSLTLYHTRTHTKKKRESERHQRTKSPLFRCCFTRVGGYPSCWLGTRNTPFPRDINTHAQKHTGARACTHKIPARPCTRRIWQIKRSNLHISADTDFFILLWLEPSASSTVQTSIPSETRARCHLSS